MNLFSAVYIFNLITGGRLMEEHGRTDSGAKKKIKGMNDQEKRIGRRGVITETSQ